MKEYATPFEATPCNYDLSAIRKPVVIKTTIISFAFLLMLIPPQKYISLKNYFTNNHSLEYGTGIFLIIVALSIFVYLFMKDVRYWNSKKNSTDIFMDDNKLTTYSQLKNKVFTSSGNVSSEWKWRDLHQNNGGKIIVHQFKSFPTTFFTVSEQ